MRKIQLDRIAKFHKTIGDKTRIQIIALLKEGPLHGQVLASKLGVTPPTISYHLTKLREIDIVYQRRDKNTIYFYLHEKKLKLMTTAVLDIGKETNTVSGEDRALVLQHFFDSNGQLTKLPAQQKKRKVVLEHLATGLEIGRTYSEQEINAYIEQYFHDFATVRREFIMWHIMHREHGEYTLNPRELWKQW